MSLDADLRSLQRELARSPDDPVLLERIARLRDRGVPDPEVERLDGWLRALSEHVQHENVASVERGVFVRGPNENPRRVLMQRTGAATLEVDGPLDGAVAVRAHLVAAFESATKNGALAHSGEPVYVKHRGIVGAPELEVFGYAFRSDLPELEVVLAAARRFFPRSHVSRASGAWPELGRSIGLAPAHLGESMEERYQRMTEARARDRRERVDPWARGRPPGVLLEHRPARAGTVRVEVPTFERWLRRQERG